MSKVIPARGMRDFLPSDVRKREYVIGIIKKVYESYGFEPLETPAVENLDTLMGKYGDEGNQLVFKILKRGEKLEAGMKAEAVSSSASHIQDSLADLALRYDLTVPLARVVANNRDKLPKFFKRFQIQPVWRADRPARGRFREFFQCDVDCVGSESMVVEVELISAVSEILTKLGFDNFKIRVNHREILFGLLRKFGIPADKYNEALVILDKLDKVGDEGVRREFAENGVVNGTDVLDLILSIGGADSMRRLEVFRDELNDDADSAAALRDLGQIFSLASSTPIEFDPTLARGLSYYTGAIMEINVPDLAGSLGGGGRYDGLIGMFGKEQIPACGFSIGLERILVVMDEREMFPPEIADSQSADVLVTIWSDETIAESLKLADELRAQGVRVTLYPQADKEDKQWKYANSIGVPWICTINDADIAEGMVTFQNLRTRERFRDKSQNVSAKIKQENVS